MRTKYMTDKKVLVYCRESRDDYGEKYERIETQRDILLDFCERQGLVNIVDIIMDDNVSGTSFKRLEDIKRRMSDGEIDIFICKDASRLGRNLLESLKFIEFAERYEVSILFESEEFNPELFPLIAWFNERRAKDDSDKIRRVLKHKLENGLVISAPFGYTKKDGIMVEDEETGAVVRKMFDMSYTGSTCAQIAQYLNIIHAPSPSKGNKSFNTVINAIWNADNVRRILKNPTYTGLQVSAKRRKVSFKSKKYKEVPEDERIYIENHHEPLVSKEMFDNIQLRFHSFKTAARNPVTNPFSGMLVCGRCGRNIVVRSRKDGKPYKYVCAKYNREGVIKDDLRDDWGCNPHNVYYEDLMNIISGFVGDFMNDRSLRNEVMKSIESNVRDNSLNKQLDGLEKKETALKKRFDIIYEDKISGLLPEFMFSEKANPVLKELECIKNQCDILRKQLNEIETNPPTDRYEELMSRIHNEGVSPEAIALLFEKIVIYEPGDLTREQAEEYRLDEKQCRELIDSGGYLLVQKALWGNALYLQ